MKSLLNLFLCAAVFLLPGCNKKDGKGEGEQASSGKAYTIAVIPKGTTHEFWKAINAGAFKARDELSGKGIKVEVIWKGRFREDERDQQIQVGENFTSKRGSGIV